MLMTLRPPWGRAASDAVAGSIATSLRAGVLCEDPFRHWLLSDVLPTGVLNALRRLPLPPPARAQEDGARTDFTGRHYVTPELAARYPACAALAQGFQDRRTVDAVARRTGARLDGSCLRLELALDVDGFRLEPHTDLGAKCFTLLIYLDAEGQRDLGTDIYRDPQTWCKQAPFRPGAALAFVPGAATWHGFEPRLIQGVRRSLIVNYVDASWRDRDQLAFPDTPVAPS